MTSDDDRATLLAADRLESAMRDLSEDIAQLRQHGKRSRVLIHVMGVMVAVIVLLGLGLWGTVNEARDAADEAKHATSTASQALLTQRIACESGNRSSKLSKSLWTYALQQTTQAPTTSAAERRKVAEFRAFLESTFAPIDCAALAPPVATTR